RLRAEDEVEGVVRERQRLVGAEVDEAGVREPAGGALQRDLGDVGRGELRAAQLRGQPPVAAAEVERAGGLAERADEGDEVRGRRAGVLRHELPDLVVVGHARIIPRTSSNGPYGVWPWTSSPPRRENVQQWPLWGMALDVLAAPPRERPTVAPI